MVRIAIVDDSKEDRLLLEGYLSDYEKERNAKLSVKSFDNGEDFLESCALPYDIVLLDIEMPLIDGITTAKKLRERDELVSILFITNMAQYAVKGYEVNALDFMVKPLQYFIFATKLDRAVWNSDTRKERYIGVAASEGFTRIALSKIRHVDGEKHYVSVVTDSARYRVRETVTDFYERLSGGTFSRSHASYIVNLDYLEVIKGNMAVLDNGETIPISRSFKENFMNDFTNYLGGLH